MIPLVLLALPAPPDDKNVNLDDERLQDAIPKGLQKVELDLDDALFLEFEEEQAPPEAAPPAEASPGSMEQEVGQKREHALPAWKKTPFWGILLIAVLMAAGAFWFFKPKPAPQNHVKSTPSAASTPAAHAPTPPLTPREPKAEALSRRTYVFDPFVIEHARGGHIYFLTYRIYIPGAPSILVREMEAKTTALRDDVFRYLKRTEPVILTNPENDRKFKEDLLAVINKSLKNGQISEVLIEGHVVR